MEDKKSIVVDFVKSNGPVLPVQISKHINMNILFAGAILSELAHNKRILITTVKKGGSPFYYIKGQEDKLQQLSQYISGKEKEAYELLKEKKVLKDRALEPAIRVALRAIKDFAFPLNVTANNNTEIFWKWYLIGDEQVSNQIKQMLGVKEEKKVMEKKTEEKILEKETVMPITAKEEKKKVLKPKTDNFYNTLVNYFAENKIVVLSSEIIKKDKEFNHVVKIPSNIGELMFYVKAKNKKSITESDLGLAYSEGQQRKLNTVLITNGNLTKKAKEYLEKNLKGQINFINI